MGKKGGGILLQSPNNVGFDHYPIGCKGDKTYGKREREEKLKGGEHFSNAPHTKAKAVSPPPLKP